MKEPGPIWADPGQALQSLLDAQNHTIIVPFRVSRQRSHALSGNKSIKSHLHGNKWCFQSVPVQTLACLEHRHRHGYNKIT